MANRRSVMEPPGFTPSPYGLLAVASELPGPDKWQRGTTWTEICPSGNTTYDQCLDPDVADSDSPPTSGLQKPEIESVHLRAATPCTVYARFDCPAVGYGEQGVQDLAERALTRVTPWQVEHAFATGEAAGDPVVHPHLQSDTEVTEDIYPGDGRVVLSPSARQLTATALDPVEAFGRVEDQLSGCYKGVGVIHVQSGLAASLKAQNLIELRNGRYVSPAGHLVAVGAGYPGDAPDGTSSMGVSWIYGTGQVWYHRSDVLSIQPIEETLDRQQNSVESLAERIYVVGFECCLVAAPVTLGGVEAGAFDAAGIT